MATAEIRERSVVAADDTGVNLDQAIIVQILEAFTESLRTIKHSSLPEMVDLQILDRVQVPDDLQVSRNGHELRGRAVWEALLTADVQETLLEGLVLFLIQSWSKTATPRIVPIAANLLRVRDTAAALDASDSTGSAPDTGDTARTVGTVGTLVPGNVSWQDALRAMSNKNSSIGKEDIQLLDGLNRFPDLYARYLGVLFIPVEQVARELSETLTDGLIGYVAGVTDRTVRSWISGRHTVRRGNTIRLRVMLAAVRILLEAESPKVVLRWFANTNPGLDGSAPAEALQKGEKLDWVIRSAAGYALDGV